ncbi:uncharacterized protein LOC126373971 isoform X2 [Pectinophora gossypiella]|uniref:uncharacterized protein LOC126373971 isoform X2 n=1 Tax=Pectinophora gossypiella TaxID=13191 RepID=UPI00214E0A72|nr:uncharacterized protein LOC126373971 isoform X2 [Pectinophora gossypiella]
MRTKLMYIKCAVLIVILFLVNGCDNKKVTSVIRDNGGFSEVQHNYLSQERIRNISSTSEVEQSRGFFGHGGIFSLGKVLNFFPVGGERECQPQKYTVARAGICLNPYDCRQRDGKAAGNCAHGLGVCCVFEVTCGGTVQNNLTYFMSPGFPELWTGEKECSITVEKAFAGIMQLRIDFVHFTIGQPNRMTGECDEDAMIIGEGRNNFTVCGQNHGQHIYYTLPTATESREAGELPVSKSTRLTVVMRGSDMPRLWLLRLAQMPLANSAPHNCLQYFTANNGTIKTFNYASNGRHLASQDYRACIRKNAGHCAVRYTACDGRSFRIGNGGSSSADPYYSVGSGPGALGGPGTGFYGPEGSFIQGSPAMLSSTPRATTLAQEQQIIENDPVQEDQMMEADGSQTQQDEVEGSGADPQIEPQTQSTRPARPPPSKSIMQVSRTFNTRWSPYAQHYKTGPENDDFRYNGYGHFGLGLHGFGRLRCRDRITIPCENEYFLSSVPYGPGVCDPHHCGDSFCPGQSHKNCRVETSITPFAVSVHFGPPRNKQNPEDNIGACLKYQQIPCDS